MISKLFSGRSAAWLARFVRDEEVVGSNPAAPKFRTLSFERNVFMKQAPVIIAALVFALIALIHFVRFLYPFQVVIGDFIVPSWLSLLIFILSALLSIWLFRSLRSNTL